ncbi:MAG: MBL fold metallo-hydrolase [Verrucomicrobiota bacterium]
MFSLTMLGSGSAGNSALVATPLCRLLIDGGLSARQLVTRLEQCGVRPEQLDGVLLTHEHGDHVCGLEVLCRKFAVPIYCNAQTAEALRGHGLAAHRNWRIYRTGTEFNICDISVQTFPVPHDAVEPVGYVFTAGRRALGFVTDLGYPTKMLIERLRDVHTLVIETNHDEKMLQADPWRPWPVKQRIMSRHGHLSNAAAAQLIEQILPGQIERVVLGHLSRDCNTPDLAAGTVQAQIARSGHGELEIFCAGQGAISPRFPIGETLRADFQPTFDQVLFSA